MTFSCCESAPPLSRHTPVLSGDLDAKGSSAVMAVEGPVAGRQSGAGCWRTKTVGSRPRPSGRSNRVRGTRTLPDLDELFAERGEGPSVQLSAAAQKSALGHQRKSSRGHGNVCCWGLSRLTGDMALTSESSQQQTLGRTGQRSRMTPNSWPHVSSPCTHQGVEQQISTSSSSWGATGSSR